MSFPFLKKVTTRYHKIKAKNNISINVFGNKDKQAYPINLSKQIFENHIEL